MLSLKNILCRLPNLALACAVAGTLTFSSPPAANAQQVYIGSGNGWRSLITHPDQWTYVRQNVDGFYINFIELLKPDPAVMAKLSPLFTHRNAYYESDSRYKGLGGFPDGGQFSRTLQAQEMDALLKGGFKVPYTSLNYGLDPAKQADLKRQGLPAGQSRPCFAQCGPWTFGGDINSANTSAIGVREMISHSDGISTDGPLSLWQTDQGHMQSGSFSVVKYAHSVHKTAAVMVAPYNLKPRSQWLTVAQQCVRQHENAGAKPDIWIVFEYATDTPTLPETVNGLPADTITGMAYWLIHHLKDPKHWARLTVPAMENVRMRTTAASVPAGPCSMETIVPVSAKRVLTLSMHNDSTWMDLCPTLSARISGPHSNWSVRYLMNGRDVTRQMTRPDGLSFVGGLRLWPGVVRPLQVVMECKNPGLSGEAQSPSIQITLRPSVSAKTLVNQIVTLRPVLERRPAAAIASR